MDDDTNHNHNHISTTICDSCGRKGPALVYHHLGAPVLAHCRSCAPDNFEAQSRREIEAWLDGGEFQ